MGAALALSAQLAGEVQVLSKKRVTATQKMRAGKFRALAVS
jgi:tripartite-type tricarboxylate transporter receptor subunit TctC